MSSDVAVTATAPGAAFARSVAMTVDPRSLNYPGINDDRQTAEEGLEPEPQAEREGDRRTGTNDELKELDRAERRRKSTSS